MPARAAFVAGAVHDALDRPGRIRRSPDLDAVGPDTLGLGRRSIVWRSLRRRSLGALGLRGRSLRVQSLGGSLGILGSGAHRGR